GVQGCRVAKSGIAAVRPTTFLRGGESTVCWIRRLGPAKKPLVHFVTPESATLRDRQRQQPWTAVARSNRGGALDGTKAALSPSASRLAGTCGSGALNGPALTLRPSTSGYDAARGRKLTGDRPPSRPPSSGEFDPLRRAMLRLPRTEGLHVETSG